MVWNKRYDVKVEDGKIKVFNLKGKEILSVNEGTSENYLYGVKMQRGLKQSQRDALDAAIHVIQEERKIKMKEMFAKKDYPKGCDVV